MRYETSGFPGRSTRLYRQAKTEPFKQIMPHQGPQTLVSSNTSFLNTFELIPGRMQERFLMTHFFTPPYIIPLVELVGSPELAPDDLSRVKRMLEELGMVCVVLKKFIPGFIVNRMQRAIGREVFHLLDNEVADPVEIDRAVKASLRGADLCRQVMNGYSYASEIAAVETLKKKGAKFYYPTAQEIEQVKKLGQKPYIDIVKRKIGDKGQEWVDKIFAAAKKAEEEIDQHVAEQLNLKK